MSIFVFGSVGFWFWVVLWFSVQVDELCQSCEVDEEVDVLQIHGVACGVFFAVFVFMICHLCSS